MRKQQTRIAAPITLSKQPNARCLEQAHLDVHQLPARLLTIQGLDYPYHSASLGLSPWRRSAPPPSPSSKSRPPHPKPARSHHDLDPTLSLVDKLYRHLQPDQSAIELSFQGGPDCIPISRTGTKRIYVPKRLLLSRVGRGAGGVPLWGQRATEL